MLITALECHKKGITYASVHDSYWTHPSTTEEMNFILREQFYQLHSRPLLEQLKQYWEGKYQIKFPDLPKRGDLDLQKVMESKYFFS